MIVPERADGEDVLGRRVVGLGLLLRGEEDLLVCLCHRLFERGDRLLAADEERHHHVREDDDVAQRQQRNSRSERPPFLRVAACRCGTAFMTSVLVPADRVLSAVSAAFFWYTSSGCSLLRDRLPR